MGGARLGLVCLVLFGCERPPAEPAAVERAAPDAGLAPRLEAACQAGDARACHELAVRTDEGQGVPQDKARSHALYLEACRRGAMPSCANAAVQLLTGEGVARAPAAAAPLLERACHGGLARTCFNLGVLLDEGRDLPRDAARAVTFFERACEDGEPEGCWSAAELLAQVGPRDEARITGLHARGCKDGLGKACYNLAVAHERGRGAPLDAQRAAGLKERAVRTLWKGCRAGQGADCAVLEAILANDSGFKARVSTDAAVLEQTCGLGDPGRCLDLGLKLAFGVGVPRDPAAADAAMARARLE